MKYQICMLLLLLLLSPIGLSGQERKLPSLTTEDVMKWRAANPDKANPVIPRIDDVSPPRKSGTRAEADSTDAERDWNERLSAARSRVKSFDRRAARAELEASRTRNNFFHPNGDAINANNTRVAELQELARRYRAEARLAQEEVNRLIDEGRESGFQILTLSPVNKNGEPNLDYYRSRFLELQTELQDARAESDVLQLQTNRYNTIINTTLNYGTSLRGRGILFYPNNGAGDVFYLNRLRSDLVTVSNDLTEMQTRVAVLNQMLAELKEEGRRAGVPPGIFR